MKSKNIVQIKQYKETEIGPLPEDWEVVRLGELIVQITDKNKNNEKLTVYTISNKLGFVESDAFFDKQVYSKKLNTYKLVKTNYFAYNPYRVNVGSIGIFKGIIGLVSPAYIVFNIKNSEMLYHDYLFFLIKSPFYMNEIMRISMSRGSVRKSLSFKDLADFLIPLPPLPEQKAIAFVLSTIQEAKEKTEKVIQAAKELKKSLMKHLFTYGPVRLDEANKIKLKETEIGIFPETWEIISFREMSKRDILNIRNGFPCGRWNETGLGVAHLRPFNITDDGTININTLKYVQTEKILDKYILKNGDVIFNNTNSEDLVGKAAYWNIDGVFVLSNHMTMIRIIDEDVMDPVFLAAFLHKKWIDRFYFKLCRRHVNQASISLNKLMQMKIPFPELEIQHKIASILSAIDKKIEAEENKKKALDELFKSMLHNLMTAKIRVNHLNLKVGNA